MHGPARGTSTFISLPNNFSNNLQLALIYWHHIFDQGHRACDNLYAQSWQPRFTGGHNGHLILGTSSQSYLDQLSNFFHLPASWFHSFSEPIGLEHFFDAFSLDRKRSLKVDAAAALHIPLNDVSDSLVVKQDRAKRFELTPVWAPVEPRTKRAKTAEVRLSSASNAPMPPRSDDNAKGSSDEEASDSSGSNSDVSSQDDSSDVSDLEKFDEAYMDFSALTDGVDPQTLERNGSGHPNDER